MIHDVVCMSVIGVVEYIKISMDCYDLWIVIYLYVKGFAQGSEVGDVSDNG